MAASVFAPTTGTYTPGHDVIGFASGTALPTELAAWDPFGNGHKVQVATVAFNADYSTSHSYEQVKYWFEGYINSPGALSAVIKGVGMVANATVSGTAVILALQQIVFGIGSTPVNQLTHTYLGKNGQVLAELLEDDANGDATLSVFNNAGIPTVQLISNEVSGGPDATTGFVKVLSQTGSTINAQLPTVP